MTHWTPPTRPGTTSCPQGGAEGAGTSERVGNGATSESNYIADQTTARIVQQAVITAPNDAAKAAAARAAVAKVEAEQATAEAAQAAAARAAAQQRAREEAEAKATAEKALLSRAAQAERSMLDLNDAVSDAKANPGSESIGSALCTALVDLCSLPTAIHNVAHLHTYAQTSRYAVDITMASRIQQ